MAIGALRFIGLAAAAVVLGVLSASFAFGKMGPGSRAFSDGRFSWVNTDATEKGTKDEIRFVLRHIVGR